MYTFFTDKKEIFEASIKLKNASPKNSSCRLVLETADLNLMFYGKINNDTCKIPVNKLREVLSSDTKGKVKLEIIAEDMYFTPWEDDFVVETSRGVTLVEVKSQNKPVISEDTAVGVTVKSNKPTKVMKTKTLNPAQLFIKELYANDITVEKITESQHVLPKLAGYFIKKHKLNESQIKQLVKKLPYIVDHLKLN